MAPLPALVGASWGFLTHTVSGVVGWAGEIAASARRRKTRERMDPAATAQYEQWLTSASRIVIRNQGGSKKPVVETIALDVFGKRADGTTGLFGALILEVSVDPEKKEKPNSSWSSIRNAEPWWVFRAELKLPDGRVVMDAANAGMNSTEAQYDPMSRPVIDMQVMDRDGPVCMKDASPSFEGMDIFWNPLLSTSQTRVTHPQSADETLRQGYQLCAPGSINRAIENRNKLNVLLGVPTLGFVPALLSCCIPEPGVHFELTELRSGRALVGARWTKKGRITYNRIHRIPYGDTIEFLESAPLQVRKDMLAIAFYRLALAAAAPVISSA